MTKALQFGTGLLLLLALEFMRVYFIMPFPGSQRAETIHLAYFLHHNIIWFRIIGFLIIIFPAIHFFTYGSKRAKWLTGITLFIFTYTFFLLNYRFIADEMFFQPKHKIFAGKNENKIAGKDLVLGVTINSESKAYPIEIIGYHHQVRDTVGGTPVMVTYCTVCRTGRVYSPVVEGKPEEFRLVGMDHFNAMFEDQSTKSWWRQVNGEAVAGPLKGKTLATIPAEQMTLQAWLVQNPGTLIMQPDTIFKTQYESLRNFDEGTTPGTLLRKDSLSWKEKSWIVGVQVGMHARAYDWHDLLRVKVINDTVGGTALAIVVQPDSASFNVWERDSLQLTWNSGAGKLQDVQTGSTWAWNGEATDGRLKGHKLPHVQSYQEFWHSWKTFRPQTTRYVPAEVTNR
jgi:hypothetical protein